MALLPKVLVDYLSSDPAEEEKKIWGKLSGSKHIPVTSYLNYWRERIYSYSGGGKRLSSGWIFSTISGLAQYEQLLLANNELRKMYYKDRFKVTPLLDKLSDNLDKHLGGVIYYGYGNLLREAKFLERLKSHEEIWNKQSKVGLIDSSYVYHTLANTRYSPLLKYIQSRKIISRLVDFENDSDTMKEHINYVRDDLNPHMPQLHVFFGNTAANMSEMQFAKLANRICKSGDYLLLDYANYSPKFFRGRDVGYVENMAISAAAETFHVAPHSVTATVSNKNRDGSNPYKITKIALIDPKTNNSLEFNAVLRRKFDKSELTNIDFSLVHDGSLVGDEVYCSLFRKS